MKKICVIGSLNIDLTVTLPRFNEPGETIFANDFKTYTGGKGGNQAVAAAKLGGKPCMAGALGADGNAEIYRKLMKELQITDLAATVEGVPSGVALIEVDAKGENRIAVVSGANMKVDRAYIDSIWEQIASYDVFLFQLEIPMDTVIYAAKKLHEAGKTVILDPAPAAPLPEELLPAVDFLTPNETELAILTGCKTETEADIEAAAKTLIARGVKKVIAKMGARGAMVVSDSEVLMVPGFKVTAVDTTAAGDSFNAGLGVAIANGLSEKDAIRFANAVGALSTTAVGAQGAMPTYRQTMDLINQ